MIIGCVARDVVISGRESTWVESDKELLCGNLLLVDYRLKANNREVHVADFTQYIISSGQLMGIFETADIRGQSLAVYSYRYSFYDQDMTGIYSLQSPREMAAQASYPMHLIGAALMAKVVDVAKDKI